MRDAVKQADESMNKEGRERDLNSRQGIHSPLA